MSDDVLRAALGEAMRFAEPVVDAAAGPANLRRLFAGAGWDLDALAGIDVDALGTSVDELVQVSQGLVGLADGGPQDFDAIADTIGNLLDLAQAVDALAATMRAPLQLSQSDVETLALDLLDFLAVRYLQAYRPVALSVLILLALADPPDLATPPATLASRPGRLPLRRPRLALGRIPDLVSDPAGLLRERWLGSNGGLATQESADRLADLLFPRVADLARALGADAMYGAKPLPGVSFGAEADRLLRRALTLLLRVPLPIGADDEGTLEGSADVEAAITVGATIVLTGRDGAGLGVVVLPFGEATVTAAWPRWALQLEVESATDPSGTPLGFAIDSRGITVPAGASPAVRVFARVERRREAGAPAAVLGGTGTRLELGSIAVGAGGRFSASTVDPEVDAEVLGARIVVAPGDGDSFLRAVLPSGGLQLPFELGVNWSRSRGLVFRGGASLEVDLPVGVDLGFLRIPVLNLSLAVDGGGLTLGLAATADVAIGPIGATIERMGVGVRAAPPPAGRQGNAGPVDLELRFLPPKGIGLGIQAGPVGGGGYLFLDFDAGEYAGLLHLQIGPVSATAVGLLQTKLPGGIEGFSLIVIISASFPPIQLGYGFTLNGLGGLLGVNRVMNVDALRDGIRSGAAGSLMFPQNPAANARQIVADVGAIFPPAQDQFVVGPMAKLGWGTPPLVTGTIAVVIQLPTIVIAIIGRLQIALPEAEEATVVLMRIDVVGVIDIGRAEVSVDGTLQGSRIATFPLDGDFALRARFGADPLFALSTGGFHPRFSPPPGFPALRRLSLSIAGGDNPRIRLEAYMALTPATLQFGARAEIYASADLGLVGFFEVDAALGFDVLIQFDPFGLEAELFAHAALRRNGSAFLSVELNGILRGPEPWEVEGAVKFKILFTTHKVKVRHQVGERRSVPPPPIVPIAALVREALGDARVWHAVLPERDPGVRVREAEPGAGVLAHPLGQLEVRQNRAPLGVELQKVGEGTIEGPTTVTLSALRVGTMSIAQPAETRDMFAPGQFFRMSEDERLTGPAFEEMRSGARAAVDRVAGHGALAFELVYEEYVVDDPDTPATLVRPPQPLAADVLRHGFLGGPAATGEAARSERFAGPELGISVTTSPEWAVVATADDGDGTLSGAVRSRHATAAEARAAAGRATVVVPVTEVDE